jgi:hypothetical protein
MWSGSGMTTTMIMMTGDNQRTYHLSYGITFVGDNYGMSLNIL